MIPKVSNHNQWSSRNWLRSVQFWLLFWLHQSDLQTLFVQYCTKNELIVDMHLYTYITAKFYSFNTVDSHKYYDCQFTSPKARWYGCFTHTTVLYKPYCMVMVHRPRHQHKGAHQEKMEFTYSSFKYYLVTTY